MIKLDARKKEKKEEKDEAAPKAEERWFERAGEAAKRFNVQIPEDLPNTAEIESRLRQLEQEDGE